MKKHILIFFILIGCIAFNQTTAQINYQWVKSISSAGACDDIGKSIVVDNAGSVYVTGKLCYGSAAADFNPYGTNPVPATSTGQANCFFAKYDAEGNCEWAKSLESLVPPSFGIGIVTGTGIAVDASHNVYLVGFFKDSVDFDPGSGLVKLKSEGGIDCFLAKYDANGDFVWAKHFGGTADDLGTSIVVDGLGTGVYITGQFSSLNSQFKNSLGVVEQVLVNTNLVNSDIFLAKYETGGAFGWARGFGGTGEDIGTSIAVDPGNTYIALTGSFQLSADFNPGGTLGMLTPFGSKDAFVAKYFLVDGTFGWAKNLGKIGGTAGGTGIALSSSKVYLTGVFKGAVDFDPDTPALDIAAVGLQDIFYAQYNLSDGSYGWVNNIGSNFNPTDSASVSNIVIDLAGNLYLTGTFEGKAGFNPLGGDTLCSSGNGDVFFAKYDNNGDKVWARNIGADTTDVGYGIAVDTSENVYLTGTYQHQVNFDPGAGTANRTSAENFGSDIFIAKFREGTSIIAGNVIYNGGTTLGFGYNYVNLYTQTLSDGNAAMHLVERVQIDTLTGNYTFNDVCVGNYIVLAIADTFEYPLAAATYFGDSTHWQQATPIIITLPNTTFTSNITMRKYLFLNGSASLSGTILEGVGYDRIAGTPIQGIPIGLEGDPGSIVAHTETDGNGNYTFINLPEGCYKIYVNIPGLPMDSTYHECLDSLEVITNLNFIADSGSIYIDPTSSTGEQIKGANTKLNVYPNPHKGSTTIEYTLQKTNRVQIEVYNLLGEKVAELLNEQKPAGAFKCRFNASDRGLNAGIYLLNLKVGDEISTKKIIQIE